MLPSIGLGTYLVFVGAAVALILTPGPDTVFVLTQGVSSGKRGGLASAFGVSTGILVHTVSRRRSGWRRFSAPPRWPTPR